MKLRKGDTVLLRADVLGTEQTMRVVAVSRNMTGFTDNKAYWVSNRNWSPMPADSKFLTKKEIG